MSIKEANQCSFSLDRATTSSSHSSGRATPEAFTQKQEIDVGVSLNLHDRIMRRREVEFVCGLSRSTLYREIAAKNFPAPVRLSKNTVGFLASQVFAWLAARRTRAEADATAKQDGRS